MRETVKILEKALPREQGRSALVYYIVCRKSREGGRESARVRALCTGKWHNMQLLRVYTCTLYAS